MLLEYFGEESDHDCGQCDVCLSRKNQSSEEEKLNAITEVIKKLLKDGQWHPVTQLKELPFPTPQIEQAIKYMMAEEMLEFEEGRVRGKS
jgi:ATP-dependent DNA helicase RecQ